MEKEKVFWFIVCTSLLVIGGPLYHPVQAAPNTVPIIGVIPLVAFNISVSAIHETDVTITWNTNEEVNSTIEYGPTISYGSVRTNPMIVTNHTLTLDGLSSATVYHYRIISIDPLGNKYESADSQFTTGGIVPTTSGGGQTGGSGSGGPRMLPSTGEAFYNGVSIPVTGTGALTSGTITASVNGMSDLRASWTVIITKEPPAGARFITTILAEPPNPTRSAFETMLASQGLRMAGLAYVMEVRKTQPVETGNAIIRMDVNRLWVSQNGGVDAVRIIRQGDDGLVQLLETEFSNYDMGTGYMNFRAISYDGLSVFALIAVESAPGTVPASLVLTPMTTAVVPTGIVISPPAPPRFQTMVIIVAIVMMIVLGLILDSRVRKK
jgi:hypothetical protein